jgi:hypothetical protein
MKTTLFILLATVALAVVLGPLTLGTINGGANAEAGSFFTGKGGWFSLAGDAEERRDGKRNNHDDDDDDD